MKQSKVAWVNHCYSTVTQYNIAHAAYVTTEQHKGGKWLIHGEVREYILAYSSWEHEQAFAVESPVIRETVTPMRLAVM